VTALKLARVSHRFGSRPALKNVSLAVQSGSFTVLLGPNGAGKTTLMSLACSLYRAQAGSVSVFGYALSNQPRRALAQIGVVFQMPTLDLDLTVAESLRYHASLHGLSADTRRERIAREGERFGIADRLNDQVRSLSGGLRRRAELARALLHGPRLLLCDEATVGLDHASRRAILAHVRALCQDEGLSVLWATHLLDEVEPADRVIILNAGEVRWDGKRPGSLPREEPPPCPKVFSG
jgi:ABC-2 type transport system ATP-binding protein